MFKKGHRSVSTICDSFTQELELTQAAEEAKADLLRQEIAEKSNALQVAEEESRSALNAVTNIRKLFGGAT